MRNEVGVDVARQVAGDRHPTGPLADEARGNKRRPSRATAASKQGWKLFNEDVRKGRFFALVGLAFLFAAAVSFVTSPEYVVASVKVEGSKVLSDDQANEIAGVQGLN